jgi:hypothetical protein
MSNTILLAVLIGTNLITLALVYLIFSKNKASSQHLEVDLGKVEESQKEIEQVQENFKKVLEEVIAKDRQMIENTSNAIIKYYQETVQSITSNYNLNAQKLSTVLNQDLNHNLERLSAKIASQAEEIQKVFAVDVQKNLNVTNKKLEDYYQKRLSDIEAQIYQIIEEAAKKIVAKSINIADHQELVRSALEQARREKFFG